ncbi:GNAT family N-acetyltransferase [Halovulum dunhuangense]|uniref:GNAT family N-acetyltransferase n=1 Tax=Halovulum dunhuangense TaxID=1505036 RepID=A0A849KVA8_9RHOB|nr:GNAT family N-acetyltransferase [Halovulum dunhuangense]NNU79318.1 GNAT family N-acetyltransferase [Halovulum dunhuangense]
MTELPAGSEVEVIITCLEMTTRPEGPRPDMPMGPPMALLSAEAPPAWYFLDLYRAVGQDYEWTDRFEDDPEDLRRWLADPQVTLWTLMRSGWPAGFFVLDGRAEGEVELSYFGLVPEAVGMGLGLWLLRTAVHLGWDRPGIRRLMVETCTLDHPRALGLYQRAGFEPVSQARKTRILSRPRQMTPPGRSTEDHA